MKQLLLLITLSLFASNEIVDGNVEITTYWKEGDIQNIVIKEGSVEYEGDEIVKKDITISNATIKVLEETDSSYTIEWLYTGMEEEKLNVEVEEKDPMDERIEEMFENMAMIYQTDEFGTFEGVLNMDEIIENTMDSLKVLMKEEMEEMGEDGDVFISAMKELFLSEEMQEEMIRDIVNYHYYHGSVLVADTTLTYKDEMENRLGGDNIPMDVTISVETDLTQRLVHINEIKEMEEAGAKDAINDGMKKLKAPKRKKFKKELQEAKFHIKDVEKYIYDFEYGWLKLYERKRVYTSEDKRNERFLMIEEK